MTTESASNEVPLQSWEPGVPRARQSVEELELRNGFSVMLSHFDPGEPVAFSFTEPEDMFGFGFHLIDGARFQIETAHFETCARDVWACATPRGSTSRFVLPASGFRTVSVRFDPDVANEYFDGGGALPRRAAEILRRVREDPGIARLPSMGPAAARCLRNMFTTGYGGAARRLYLESCVLELLAGLIGSPAQSQRESSPVPHHHRERAMAACAYLDRNFRDPPTIPQLARIVGTNEFTLKRAFKSVVGTTLFAYVSRRRMERAELLLRQGMTVSMAAQEVGYECVRSFSAAFRRQVGQPPSSVRRASR